jgi:phage-related protein
MADVTATVRTVVTVVDQATGPLRAISGQFKNFGSGISNAVGKLKSLGDAGPLKSIGGVLSGVMGTATKVAGAIASIGVPIAGLAGAAGLGSLTAAITGFAKEGEELLKLSRSTGETVEKFQELAHWADIGGVSQDALASAAGRVNKMVGTATGGSGKAAEKAAETFRELGIATKDASGKARTFGDMAPELALRFSQMTDATERARLGAALFGKGYQTMLPLLMEGPEQFAKMSAEARKFGIITTEQAQAADDFGDAQQKLGAALKGVANVIGAALVPALIPLVEAMAEWVAANREWIAGAAVETVNALAIGFKALGAVIGVVIDAIRAIGEAWLQVSPIIMGVVAVLEKIGAAALAGLQGVATAIGGELAAIGTTVKGWGATLVELFSGVWASIRDTLVEAFAGIATAIGDALRPVKEAITTAFTGIREAIAGPLEAVGEVAARAWQGIAAAFSAGWAVVRPILEPFAAALQRIVELLQQVAGLVATAFSGITDRIASAKAALGGWWSDTKEVYSEAEAAEEKRILKAKRTAEKAAAKTAPEAARGPGPWAPELLEAPEATPTGLPERVSAGQIEAEKEAAKDKKAADKKAATAAKNAAEKAQKDAERAAAKQAKDAEKAAAKPAKTLPELAVPPLLARPGPEPPTLPEIVGPPVPAAPTLPEIAARAPRGGYAAAEAGTVGSVQVLVRFENAPPGTRVSTSTSGAVSARADVGYSMPQLGGRVPSGLGDVLRTVARGVMEAL